MKNSLFILLGFSVVFALQYSCSKKGDSQFHLPAQPDIRGSYVGQYLPLYFGSSWQYQRSAISGSQKTWIEQLTWRYDSLQDVIHIYNSSDFLQSWIYVHRISKDEIVSGGGKTFVTGAFLDSAGKWYVLDSNDQVLRMIRGGLDTLSTKWGAIPCIVTWGISGAGVKKHWIRHFGQNLGMLREEEFSVFGADTSSHFILELDSAFINR